MSASISRDRLSRALRQSGRPLAGIFKKYAVASSVLPAMAAFVLQSAPALAEEHEIICSGSHFGPL